MSTEIIKVLDAISERLGVAIDWTTENIMPYLEHLLKRYATLQITYACINISIGVILLLITTTTSVILYKSFSRSRESKNDTILWENYICESQPSFTGMIVIIVSVLLGIASLMILANNVHDLVEWIIVPEYPFTKEIMDLIN